MSQIHHEDTFQREIAEHLAQHGWLHSPEAHGYDVERALWPEDLLGWLEDTDPDNYARLVPPEADPAVRERGQRRILDRVAKVLATSEDQGGGTLKTLRGGVDVPGARRFSLMQAPVSTDLNPQATRRYAHNRLRVVREVRYSARKQDRIDLVLFLNGLPVATIETKTSFSQPLEAAKKQYRQDRKPQGEPLLTPFRGALVHFAVAEENVAMTTALAGEETFFLPFDTGHDNGKGNPPRQGRHRTSYLWEEVLDRDTWLTILTKFIYINHETRTDPVTGEVQEKRQLRFPRYHQWRAVTRLTQAARSEGPGHKYLIQHSAGSGKTDSIAWTAHRLADLQHADGQKVFDAVIVISDRQVLDSQLQDAVDQLTHVTGKFQPITRGSEGSKTAQFLDALAAEVPIIGLTLQTFPHALAKMREEGGVLAGRRFAVVADEAHSSQTGAASDALKELLYRNQERQVQRAEQVQQSDRAQEPLEDDQDALNLMAARTDEDQRISFFAFTATPKAKTLELFGRRDEHGELQPFDLYSMKQAIQEGFILDVLKNYTSYDVAARIARDGEETDEEIDVRRATRAVIGQVELHPTNVSSKVHEIIRHFQHTVRPELGGRAKAMVVTASRQAAVAYHRAFQQAVEEQNLDLKALVAFSGEVEDPDAPDVPGIDRPTVTEASENPDLRGRDLAVVFRQPDQHVLIVANKYQTGFDEPLLVGMYVDKKLSGISAVQTLSRLNRQARGKQNTYILDFVNEPEQIQAAFQEYYEDAQVVTESDPDLVADLKQKLENAGIITRSEVDHFWSVWRDTQHLAQAHSRLSAALDPAVDRFAHQWRQAVLAEDAERLENLREFRKTLAQYTKTYAFFSQILHYGDEMYEKLSTYAEMLARKLANFTEEDADPDYVDVEDVVLTHYRLEKLREEDMRLHDGGAEGLRGMTEAGIARNDEAKRADWDTIVEKINRYFGDLDVDDEYKVQGIQALIRETSKDDRLHDQARHNTREDFQVSPTLHRTVEDAVWSHESSSQDVMKAIREMSTADLVHALMDFGLYEHIHQKATHSST